jgi:hypothetical protein
MSVARTTAGNGFGTISERATEAKVSPWLIRKEIKLGNLRARRIGRCVRILDEEFARWRSDYEANAKSESGADPGS